MACRRLGLPSGARRKRREVIKRCEGAQDSVTIDCVPMGIRVHSGMSYWFRLDDRIQAREAMGNNLTAGLRWGLDTPSRPLASACPSRARRRSSRLWSK